MRVRLRPLIKKFAEIKKKTLISRTFAFILIYFISNILYFFFQYPLFFFHSQQIFGSGAGFDPTFNKFYLRKKIIRENLKTEFLLNLKKKKVLAQAR